MTATAIEITTLQSSVIATSIGIGTLGQPDAAIAEDSATTMANPNRSLHRKGTPVQGGESLGFQVGAPPDTHMI
jgi:hypothetical protein